MLYFADSLNFWGTNLKGELAALSAAFFWAISSVVYTGLGQRIPPLELNLLKGMIAIALLIITLLGQGQLFPEIDPTATGLLFLSGIVGIGLGDTVYFQALNSLGARKTLLLGTLAPAMTALLALIFLQEHLTVSAWSGIVLTLLGVAWVVTERVPHTTNGTTQLTLQGIIFGLLTAAAQAIGAVLSRAALADSNISPIWSSLVRLIAGVLIVLLLILLNRRPANLWLKPLHSGKMLGVIILTAFFSTYLGIGLQQVAFKFAAAGVAQTLLATSPLFVIPVAMGMGDTVSFRAILGVFMALAGVALLFWT